MRSSGSPKELVVPVRNPTRLIESSTVLPLTVRTPYLAKSFSSMFPVVLPVCDFVTRQVHGLCNGFIVSVARITCFVQVLLCTINEPHSDFHFAVQLNYIVYSMCADP